MKLSQPIPPVRSDLASAGEAEGLIAVVVRGRWLTDFMQPALATPSRRRMTAIALAAGVLGIYGGSEVLLPLWATKDLGLDAGQWAHVRSLRMFGAAVGVIFLGALSDRFGQRMLAILCMLASAFCLAMIAFLGRSGLWLVNPIYGAFFSTIFVNLNTMTQQVSTRRPGLANSIFRGVGAGTGIVAPALATFLVAQWGGFEPVMYALALLLFVGAAVLLIHPTETAPPLGSLRDEFANLWQGYREVFRQRYLVRVINLHALWFNAVAAVGVFAAIRFARELHQSDQGFGVLSSVTGAVTLGCTLLAALVVDRLPVAKLCGVLAIAASLAALAMGLGDSLTLSAVGFLAHVALLNALLIPSSMWIGQAALPGTQTSAFSVYKVVTVLYLTAATALLGVLETWIGIRLIFLFTGGLGAAVGACYFFLPEPKRQADADV